MMTRLLKLLSLCLAMLLAGPLLQMNCACAAQPRLLATDVVEAVLIEGAGTALVYDSQLSFMRIDLATGETEPWKLDWTPEEAGLTYPTADSSFPRMAASPDGQTVVIARSVEFDSSDPGQEWPHVVVALLTCKADGSVARCAAFVEATDGGPQLDFSQDGRYLIGPWFCDCEPTPAGYEAWLAGLAQEEGSVPGQPLNALDLQSGRIVNLPALADTEWGVDKSPYSDNYAFQDMDSPDWLFGSLSGLNAGPTGRWSPLSEDGYIWTSTWVGPELMLARSALGQLLIDMQGASWPAGPGSWLCYCCLADGRSFFSRDGGASIELGRVDWRSGQVDEGRSCPELAHFATMVDEYGWPERVDSWLALPDGSGALVNTPGIDQGQLYLINAD